VVLILETMTLGRGFDNGRNLRRRQLHKLKMQFFLRFGMIEIEGDAIDRTHFAALRGIKMADAFGAFCGVDFVDFDAHVDGLVRAFGLAHVAVNALIGNFKCHDLRLLFNLAFEGCADEGMHKVFHVTA
jgi:hypothetical protein